MSSLEQQVKVFQRKAEREQKAREMAETQLEDYSLKIYQANQSLAKSLELAELRQLELKFLNKMSVQVVLDNSRETMLANILPLIGRFVGGHFGFAFQTDAVSQLTELQSWLPAEHQHKAAENRQVVASLLVDSLKHNLNDWSILPYNFDLSVDWSGLLTSVIHVGDNDSVTLCFGISQEALREELINVLNTASSQLISGLKRRAYESKILKRNKQLQESIANLESVQAQLIQSEKMASLGQLAAGVAHEINNPVGYINANSDVMRSYAIDIKKCIEQLHTETENGPLTADKLAQISNAFELDYVLQDMLEILDSNRSGIERIKEIVSELSTFSHPGDQQKLPMCVSDAINHALLLVVNELKYKHTVDNQLPKQLPAILANSAQLQQVFVILIINAVHAMPDGGTLTISHELQSEQLTLTISDTGIGIKAENINQIFTPFFTTKPVGSGTGLGLSIAHSIIKAHDADIQVISEEGKGTAFSLTFRLVKQ